jgi:glycosyltransferase involved in cell wall biosynthesis
VTRRILFISKGDDSASTRYRALQFFPLLRAAGYEPGHAAAAGSPATYFHALRLAASADIVVVLRKTFPGPLLWLLRRVSRKLVFDFDDAIFCNTDGTPSSTRMHRFGAMAAGCDHLFAGNRFLADNVTRHNRAVTIVPTCIDIARYAGDYPRPQDSFDLVWIGSRSTRKYLVEALPALRLAAARIPQLRLKIIADFDLPDAGLTTLAIPWSEDTEALELGSAHLGIAPMRDDDWSRGKCALKVLQYMAAGLPVVSSGAGANAEVIVAGETGYLVGDDESWAERIAQLAADAALRERMGAAGRRRASADYSLAAGFARIAGVFDTLS